MGTNGIPHRGPHVVLDREELAFLARLLVGKDGEVAERIAAKIAVARGTSPKLLTPTE